jgi:hypothetical protein
LTGLMVHIAVSTIGPRIRRGADVAKFGKRLRGAVGWHR